MRKGRKPGRVSGREPSITCCGRQGGKYTEQRGSQLSGNYYLHQNLPRKPKHYSEKVKTQRRATTQSQAGFRDESPPCITGCGGRVVSIQNNGAASCPAIVIYTRTYPGNTSISLNQSKCSAEHPLKPGRLSGREPITGCGSQGGKYTEQRGRHSFGNYYLHHNLPRKHKHYYASVQRHGARQLDKDVRIILT